MNTQDPALQPKDSLLASTWVLVCGFAIGLIAIIFFMGYIILLTVNKQTSIPDDIKNLIEIVFSFSIGLSYSFIGGHAAVKGKINIPYVKQNPILFSAGGGIAAFFITLVLSHSLFHPKSTPPPRPLSPLISGSIILHDGFPEPAKSGFNFRKQQVVDWYSGDADILAASPGQTGMRFFVQHDQPPYNKNATGIDAANGEVIQTNDFTLDNSKPCPLTGYKFHWIEPKQSTVYCLRTRDGKSYVKFIVNSISNDRISIEYAYREDGKNEF
ncbi:hypothetical protein [Desulfovibrio sp. TomC]|uniref:hypothetical protein n=1 Tax=Desulfovibrio sp. TomC TaxID=1562888 RepID=UPI0012E14FA2|nr:hypothetical protein [Desulfovibrio sp. TomC]